ncbi:nitroreductase [Bradyrhizobium sp. SYSU BS000235]|uniref:nitroreductase n=1 Tax=Bradyrhizobium sp. SYSU BS000235 TaxID=3411332 RepID=UPI003C73B799
MPSAQQEMIDPAPSCRDERGPASDLVDHVIKSRFACRSFSDRVVPRDLVEEVLEVARFAPSGANIQPWHVYVVTGARKDELSAVLLKAHEEARDQYRSEYQYYASPLPDPYVSRREQFGRLFYGSLGIQQWDVPARARQTARNYSFFGAAVGLIITIDRRLQVGSWLDLGMFIQNVMIAAGARGLQTCPQETFAKYHALLRGLLPITPDEMVVCGMSMGYGETGVVDTGSLMPKAAVADFAHFAGFADSADHGILTENKP